MLDAAPDASAVELKEAAAVHAHLGHVLLVEPGPVDIVDFMHRAAVACIAFGHVCVADGVDCSPHRTLLPSVHQLVGTPTLLSSPEPSSARSLSCSRCRAPADGS